MATSQGSAGITNTTEGAHVCLFSSEGAGEEGGVTNLAEGNASLKCIKQGLAHILWSFKKKKRKLDLGPNTSLSRASVTVLGTHGPLP